MRALELAFTLTLAACPLQQWGSLDSVPARDRQYVSYTAEQQTVQAGKRSLLELRFEVRKDFHINSHTPRSEFLIPTTLDVQAPREITLAPAEYPPGKPYTLIIDPGEKLDVYADSFTVKLPVRATPGAHELHGSLHYQACDKAACYPPRELAVTVLFTAK